MRSILCILMILLYTAAFNVYIYELVHPYMSHGQVKLLYNYITLGMLVFYLIDLKTGFESEWHKQFNLICILSVIINIIFIILTHQMILSDPVFMFCTFNGSVFVTSLMILISGGRHNEFNN